jgi:hypothetical protein
MRIQGDDPSRNIDVLETVLEEIVDHSLETLDEVHSGEYGTSGYTEFYIERDVGRLEDALENEQLKTWAVERMVTFHDYLTPVLDEEFR